MSMFENEDELNFSQIYEKYREQKLELLEFWEKNLKKQFPYVQNDYFLTKDSFQDCLDDFEKDLLSYYDEIVNKNKNYNGRIIEAVKTLSDNFDMDEIKKEIAKEIYDDLDEDDVREILEIYENDWDYFKNKFNKYEKEQLSLEKIKKSVNDATNLEDLMKIVKELIK